MADPNPHPRQPAPGLPTPAAIDGQHAERAGEVHHRIDTALRRSRRIAAVLTPAVLAVLMLGCSAAGNVRDSATPPSPATPGPPSASGLLTLAAHPLLTEEEGNPVRSGAAPAKMSACVSTPLTWGAAESDAATYGSPGEPRFGNEFVLRYDTVAAAHTAVTDAWRLFLECPTPRKVAPAGWGLPVWGPRWHLNEYFANERQRFATPLDTRILRNTAKPVATYSLRVARRQNVVVVVEAKESDDRAQFVLSVAMAKATGDMQRERVILSAVGGRGRW
jgi:hypothetical protein